jgi:hypothetical protein
MASFISVSEASKDTVPTRRPSDMQETFRLVALLVVLVCSTVGAWRYVLKLSPEVDLYTYAARKKITLARKLDELGLSKIVICGGSSCAFGVNTDVMQKAFDLPVVNFGMHAGMGAPVLAGLALKYTKPGDTLVVSLEPHLLFTPFDWPALGDQISYALKEPELCEGGPLHLSRKGKLGIFLTMRPGAQNMLLFLPSPLFHHRAGNASMATFNQSLSPCRRHYLSTVRCFCKRLLDTACKIISGWHTQCRGSIATGQICLTTNQYFQNICMK